MKSRWQVIVGAALAVFVVGAGTALAGGGGNGATASKHGGKQWKAFKKLDSSRLSQVAYLTGLEEVDDQGENDNGDPDAKGSANLLQVDERTVCYGFMVKGTDTPTDVHVHRAKAGENGDIVLEFANIPQDANGVPSGDPGASSGCKVVETPEEMDTLRRIRKNPAGYYVNIHTETFPDGAVRGQLGPVWYQGEGA
jgi:CHRD domain